MDQTDDEFYAVGSQLSENLALSLNDKHAGRNRSHQLPARPRADKKLSGNENTFLDSYQDMGGDDDVVCENRLNGDYEEDVHDVVNVVNDESDDDLIHDGILKEQVDLLDVEDCEDTEPRTSVFSFEIDDEHNDDDCLITSIERATTYPVQKPECPILGLDSVQIEVRICAAECLRATT